MFFGPPVANFLDAPSSLVLLFSDLQRPPTCCSHAHDASPEFKLHNVLSTSGQHCVDLKFSMGPKLYRVTIFFAPHVPNFLAAPSSLVLIFSDLQRAPTCCSHAQDASPEFRLHSVLSTSGQHCVDLKFSMGPKLYRVTIFFAPHVPNFLAAPSSLVLIFSDLQRAPTCCSHAQDASPEFRLHSVLSNSGQHCVDLSPMENYSFRWDPNFIIKSPSSLVHMLQTFWRNRLLTFSTTHASHVLGLQLETYTSSATPSCILPCGSLSSRLPFPACFRVHLT